MASSKAVETIELDSSDEEAPPPKKKAAPAKKAVKKRQSIASYTLSPFQRLPPRFHEIPITISSPLFSLRRC